MADKAFVVKDSGRGTDSAGGNPPAPQSPEGSSRPTIPNPHHDPMACAIHLGMSWNNIKDAVGKWGTGVVQWGQQLINAGLHSSVVEQLIAKFDPQWIIDNFVVPLAAQYAPQIIAAIIKVIGPDALQKIIQQFLQANEKISEESGGQNVAPGADALREGK